MKSNSHIHVVGLYDVKILIDRIVPPMMLK